MCARHWPTRPSWLFRYSFARWKAEQAVNTCCICQFVRPQHRNVCCPSLNKSASAVSHAAELCSGCLAKSSPRIDSMRKRKFVAPAVLSLAAPQLFYTRAPRLRSNVNTRVASWFYIFNNNCDLRDANRVTKVTVDGKGSVDRIFRQFPEACTEIRARVSKMILVSHKLKYDIFCRTLYLFTIFHSEIKFIPRIGW